MQRTAWQGCTERIAHLPEQSWQSWSSRAQDGATAAASAAAVAAAAAAVAAPERDPPPLLLPLALAVPASSKLARELSVQSSLLDSDGFPEAPDLGRFLC
jgi:hypothetical protein